MCSLSFEVFPPRYEQNLDNLNEILEILKTLSPAFISVTFGAGGSVNSTKTLEVASLIQDLYHIPSIVHLPCIHSSREKIQAILTECKARKLRNILALRGDLCGGVEKSADFHYASDLISFIKTEGEFEIYAACYPETHTESKDVLSDINHLKLKVQAGAKKLITQLFYDNEDFYRFKERIALAGIEAPVYAGIMPITSKRQVEKISSMCGAKIPPKFAKILKRYEHNQSALTQASIAYASEQIIDLVAAGVEGIHLYTMNKTDAAVKIYEGVKEVLRD